MLLHIKPRKNSSGERLNQQLQTLPSDQEQMAFYKAHLKEFQQLEIDDIARKSRELLIEVANLHDNGFARFQRKWGPRPFGETRESFLQLRDDLRTVWLGNGTRAQEILYWWLKPPLDTPRFLTLPFVPDIRTGLLLPEPGNLRARLVMAVLADVKRFRICGNPDCAAPYFLAKRRTQKFCELGECTRFAQNQYALKWWKDKKKHPVSGSKATRRRKHGTQKTR